jgi:predicted MFS family arabinose efflux permease
MRYRIALLTIGTFVIGTDAFAVAGVLPDITRRLHASVASVGHLVTAFAIAYALASPVIGAATAKWDRRRLLLTALVGFSLGNILSAAAPSYGVLLASRIVCGIAAAGFTPTAVGTAGMLVGPEARGRALATVGAGLTVATVVGVPLVTLIGTELSFRATFGVIAGAAALAAAIIAATFPPVPAQGGATLRQRIDVARVPGVLPTLAVSLCAFIGGFSVYTYISPLFTHLLATSATSITLLLLAFGIAGAFGNSLGGRLTDRIGSEQCVIVGLVAASLGLLLIRFIGDAWAGAVLAIVVWGVGGWMQVPAQQARLIAIAGAAAPMAISLNASAMYLGIGVAGLVGSAVISVGGLNALGLFGAAMGIAGLALALLWYRRRARTAVARTVPA